MKKLYDVRQKIIFGIGNVQTIVIGDHVIPSDISNVPQHLTKFVIGRDADLLRIENLLKEKKFAVLVNGIGGIGKSTVIQEYLKRNRSKYKQK